VPLGFSVACIAIVSIASTTLGLALGKRLGVIAEEYAALVAGVVLILTGLTFAALKYYHVGT
jgi:putative Mn2+ efflux pump MntP